MQDAESKKPDVIPGTDLPAQEVADAIRKRGAKSASIEATTTATPTEIKGMINNVLYWYKREPVKSDDECAERLDEFFQHIGNTGEIPTVEKMCLALGVHRQTVWQWKTGQGCSATRTYMIKRAYDIMAALDAELVSKGKIPQVTYIFRAKNFFEMSDQTQLILTPTSPLDNLDTDNARRKYTEALPETTAE